jgi:uncharacterized protein
VKETGLDISVVPKSSRSAIVYDEGKGIRVYLNSPPVDGKANKECIELFARLLRVPKSSITIDRGTRGRKKRIIIVGYGEKEVIAVIRKQGSE